VAILTAGQRGAALEALGAKIAGPIDERAGDSRVDSYFGAQDRIAEAQQGEVVLVLTRAEAQELDFLAGELLHDPKELKARLGSNRYHVAIRAAQKLAQARTFGVNAPTPKKGQVLQ